MAEVLTLYSSPGERLAKQSAPHEYSSNVWDQRPLSPEAIAYAVSDVQLIGKLLRKMRETPLSSQLSNGVQFHSRRYLDHLRNVTGTILNDKNYIMEEHAIIRSEELPPDHPKMRPVSPNKAENKWNDAVAQLRGKKAGDCGKAYSNALFILQHNDWYTAEGFAVVRQLARDYPFFTAKQRANLQNPKPLERDSYDY